MDLMVDVDDDDARCLGILGRPCIYVADFSDNSHALYGFDSCFEAVDTPKSRQLILRCSHVFSEAAETFTVARRRNLPCDALQGDTIRNPHNLFKEVD